MRRLILILALLMASCSMQDITSSTSINSGIVPCDLCCEMLQGYRVEQNILIRMHDITKMYYLEETGYCINVRYNSPDTYYDGYEFSGYPRIEKTLERASPDDSITVTIGSFSETYPLGCKHYLNIDIPINFSREERYSCIFRGKVMASGLEYEELNDYHCDSVEVTC